MTEDSPDSVARDYALLPGAPDEMLGPDGALRPQWQSFVRLLDELGPEERRRRWEQARGLIHENGVTHNVYGDPNGLDRPWSLDFLPLLIPGAEWENLSAGLQQRARLLDCLLADLYGPAETVVEGILPPELVYAGPGFLRPCHGLEPPLGRWLHLYAADLVRTPAGSFEVLCDRTQSPSGAGYSLENRIVLSRVLPSIFRHCNVRRLAPFFAALRHSLAALGSARRDTPRVVLLTPGPYNETYFEHVYLARYLGYPLVQGSDLTVRDARVFLKTLGGLQPVDVILRRVDDDYCDPLELFPDSFLGVPGLIEAAREGNVAIANALGSGVLQGPGFLPFLPALCRRLLGEDLKLPSVRTWYCGDPGSRAYVLDNLSELVVKPALPTTGTDPVFGSELSLAARAELAAKIKARPWDYVAQEPVMSCTSPALVDEVAKPRRFILRSYLAAQPQGGYVVMPGGLTRIPWSADSRVVSLQKGGGSKDTWVLNDAPVPDVTLLAPSTQPVLLSRGGGDLPSRIADDLFWLGRYVQRAESASRAARAAVNRLIDVSGVEALPAVRLLARAIKGSALEGPLDKELVESLFNVLRPTTASIHRLARVLRDRISVDAWRILQAIDRDVSSFVVDPADPCSGVPDLLDGLVPAFAACVGLSTDSMTRGQAWSFLDLGHRIERAMTTARLLRDTLVDVSEDEASIIETLLEIFDSSLTYRRRYLTRLEVHALVDLLLADESNPRSLGYQASEIVRHLESLPTDWLHPRQGQDRQQAIQLRASLQLADIEVACAVTQGRRVGLEVLLGNSLDSLSLLADSISRIYFTPATVSRGLLVPGQQEPAT